tara:strand:+ start:3788 stop:4231 length:444 start_codon:yes stop_codon:yes gene_type:complete
MSANVTNLGNQALCDTLFAQTAVKSPSFTQPEQTVGSAASPSATATQVYVAGITKYVFYSPLTTATALTQSYSVTGLPATFPATFSVVGQTLAVASTAFTTAPVISVAHMSFSGTNLTLTSTPLSSTSPAFSTGTAYLKLVLEFTVD